MTWITPSNEQRLGPTKRPQGRAPVMYQSWQHLLFLHWSVDPAIIQATLPPGLFVDTFQDLAYLGVVPFFMRGVRPRFCPAVPGMSNFLELNLRTYVLDAEGNPGVWFYSLDANHRIAVKIAQTFFSLPYVYANMSGTLGADESVIFKSARSGQLQQVFHYKPLESLPASVVGTLQFFVAERYLLFAYNKHTGRLFTGQVHHLPYQLFAAEVQSLSTDLFALNGFGSPDPTPVHAMVSPGVNVEIFGLQARNEKLPR